MLTVSSQVFEGDGSLPAQALPPLDGESDGVVGSCVLIPADKYAKFPEVSDTGATFLGWVGKIVGVDKRKKKMKVKIKDDRGFEHLGISSGKYAIASLVRLS